MAAAAAEICQRSDRKWWRYRTIYTEAARVRGVSGTNWSSTTVGLIGMEEAKAAASRDITCTI